MAIAKLIPIDLHDGKQRNLKLSNLGVIRFEEFMGKSVEECLGMGFTSKLVTTLLWASLLWEEPSLTWEDASALIDNFVDKSETESTHNLMSPLAQVVAQSTLYRNKLIKKNGRDTTEELPKAVAAADSSSIPTPTT